MRKSQQCHTPSSVGTSRQSRMSIGSNVSQRENISKSQRKKLARAARRRHKRRALNRYRDGDLKENDKITDNSEDMPGIVSPGSCSTSTFECMLTASKSNEHDSTASLDGRGDEDYDDDDDDEGEGDDNRCSEDLGEVKDGLVMHDSLEGRLDQLAVISPPAVDEESMDANEEQQDNVREIASDENNDIKIEVLSEDNNKLSSADDIAYPSIQQTDQEAEIDVSSELRATTPQSRTMKFFQSPADFLASGFSDRGHSRRTDIITGTSLLLSPSNGHSSLLQQMSPVFLSPDRLAEQMAAISDGTLDYRNLPSYACTVPGSVDKSPITMDNRHIPNSSLCTGIPSYSTPITRPKENNTYCVTRGVAGSYEGPSAFNLSHGNIINIEDLRASVVDEQGHNTNNGESSMSSRGNHMNTGFGNRHEYKGIPSHYNRSKNTEVIPVSGVSMDELHNPTSAQDLVLFMVRYSGSIYSSKTDPTSGINGYTPAYSFSGIDYCIVLHSIFPSSFILSDFSKLCWSRTPIPMQELRNIECFIDFSEQATTVGKSEKINGDDECAVGSFFQSNHITPELLLPIAENVGYHLKVQGWLYKNAVKFSPSTFFNSVQHYQSVCRLRRKLESQYCNDTVPIIKQLENARAKVIDEIAICAAQRSQTHHQNGESLLRGGPSNRSKSPSVMRVVAPGSKTTKFAANLPLCATRAPARFRDQPSESPQNAARPRRPLVGTGQKHYMSSSQLAADKKRKEEAYQMEKAKQMAEAAERAIEMLPPNPPSFAGLYLKAASQSKASDVNKASGGYRSVTSSRNPTPTTSPRGSLKLPSEQFHTLDDQIHAAAVQQVCLESLVAQLQQAEDIFYNSITGATHGSLGGSAMEVDFQQIVHVISSNIPASTALPFEWSCDEAGCNNTASSSNTSKGALDGTLVKKSQLNLSSLCANPCVLNTNQHQYTSSGGVYKSAYGLPSGLRLL